jgi:protein SCO1/2
MTMPELSRRKLLALGAATPLAAALPARPSEGAASGTGAAEAREKIRRRYFPDVALVTQDNQKVRLYRDLIKDKIVIINFFYAHCEGICPMVTANLVRVQQLLGSRVGRDIFIDSFTLKPADDTPEVLKEYAEAHRIRRGWSLLTGNPEDLELLRRSLGFTNLDPRLDQDKSQHIGNVRYGSEPLMQWTAMPGMTNPESIAKAISRDFPEARS